MPLSQGQVLDNRYRVVKLLGQGGFGTVYRIWDTRFGRPLALKENLDTAPNAQRQFKREAQILYDLSHPNLPRVIDHFVIPDQGQYLVMEYADGEDFREMLEGVGGPLSETQALEWIGQVCNALEYLHTQNPPIIHRDIKPANIKITPDGKAILVDFGIAKVYDPNLSTTVGARAVTPGYSPQEQYGQGNTDARTDVYALGATLYHILTGVQPPESVLRTMGMELEEPQKLNSAISDNVEEAILKAMEPLPEKRFQNIAKFKEELMTASMTGVSQKAPATMIAQKGPSLMTRPAVVSSQPAVMPKPLSRKLPWKWIGVSGVLVLVTLVSLGVIISLLTANGGGPDVDSDSTQTAIALGISNTLMAPVTATDPPESSPQDTPVVVEVVVTEGIPDVGFEFIPGGFLEKAIAGEYAGSEVTIDGPYMDPDPDQQRLLESVAAFEDATGIKVNYIGDREFEARLPAAVASDNPPDIADFSSPVTLEKYVQQGDIVDPTLFIPESWLEKQYGPSWLTMAKMEGSEGTMSSGLWHRFNTFSLVWYPKHDFDAAGYKTPETWQEMVELMDQIVADGDTPWCVSIEADYATGWVAADWLADILLRTTSLENYDKWTNGDLKFNSSEVKFAAELMEEIWFNDDYIYGGVDSIVSTFFGDSPLPMFDDPPKCWMHRQGNFVIGFFPEGAEMGKDYDIFYFPPIDEEYGKPYMVRGSIMAMFNDRPEVRALMEYFTVPQSVSGWLDDGDALAAHKTASPNLYAQRVEGKIAELVQEATSFRYVASDVMPPEVGAGSFWEGMTDWISSTTDLDTVLQEIDDSWPK